MYSSPGQAITTMTKECIGLPNHSPVQLYFETVLKPLSPLPHVNSTFIRPSSPIWSALNLNGGTCERRRSNLIIPLTFRRYQHSLSLPFPLAKSAAVRANSRDCELASQRPLSRRGSLHIPLPLPLSSAIPLFFTGLSIGPQGVSTQP